MRTLFLVMSMHRTGSSAVAGILQDLGIGFGWMREPGDVDIVQGRHTVSRNAFNPRGNRENRELRWLHDEILEEAGGSWYQPPASVNVTDDHRRRRDEVIDTFEGDPIAVKDPRLLLVLDLYRDLEPSPIGVIRNPVAVRESLDKRARKTPPKRRRGPKRERPQLSGEGWEALWRHYNQALLDELERKPFPIVNFDLSHDLEAQGRAALAFYDFQPESDDAVFFDETLISDYDQGEEWRERAISQESVDLWDRLVERAEVVRS